MIFPLSYKDSTSCYVEYAERLETAPFIIPQKDIFSNTRDISCVVYGNLIVDFPASWRDAG